MSPMARFHSLVEHAKILGNDRANAKILKELLCKKTNQGNSQKQRKEERDRNEGECRGKGAKEEKVPGLAFIRREHATKTLAQGERI